MGRCSQSATMVPAEEIEQLIAGGRLMMGFDTGLIIATPDDSPLLQKAM